MKNPVVKYLYIICFIAVLCTPWVSWKILGKYMDSENYENRTKAEMPMPSLNDLEKYPAEIEDFLNDNLPFRNELITLNSRMDYYVFHKSSNEDVILGKDGWLFYNDKEDGDPMADFLGENLFTETQLKKIAENLEHAEKYLKDYGCEFVLFIGPNKSRIYADMMPEYYGEPAEDYAVLQLIDYLKNNTNVRVVYPYEELQEARKQLPDVLFYHKTDTHWNNAGGYVGSVALLEELGINMPSIWNDRIEIEETDNQICDLANIISLQKDLLNKETDYNIQGYDMHKVTSLSTKSTGALVYQAQDADPRKIFVYRDSFCTAMAGVLASQFNDSYMIHYKNFNNAQIQEQDPDMFVLEIVERKIENLLEFDIEKS